MCKKILLTSFIFLNIINFSYSQINTRQEYISKYQVLAIKEMMRSGIPASIIMAQACLESADGNSQLAQMSNNHFGIKCKSDWNGQTVYFDDDKHNECFRSYRTVEDSYRDHTDFLMQSIRYAPLFEYGPTDYKSWARGLKRAGYATANDYDKQLIDIIEKFKLHNLDKQWSAAEIANFKPMQPTRPDHEPLVINPYRPRNVVRRNGLKTVVVRAGDTFETIAQEFGLKDWELYSFNDYQKGYRPKPNEIIYIENKKQKASRGEPTHTFEADESMHYISQLYGIKLRPLYRRNDMKFGEQPAPGQVIYLRKKKR